MLKPFFTSVLSYKILKEYGDESLVSHVDRMLDAYEKAYKNHEDMAKNWLFREYEEDEEVVERRGYEEFKKHILTYDDGNINCQLEVLTGFDINSSRFKHTIKGAEFNLVTYFEQKSKAMFGEVKKESFVLIKNENELTPDLETRIGTILKPKAQIKRVENVSIVNQPENE